MDAMGQSHILHSVEQYYSARLRQHGVTARGVDWKSSESQSMRFEQLVKVCDRIGPFSINDYGCGYGALADYLQANGYTFYYRGFDISSAMLASASELHADMTDCAFFGNESDLSPADYSVASGIFNVKLQTGDREWHAYMLDTVQRIAGLSLKGFAFNVLTSYSDKEKQRPDLHYADPLFWFDYCKRNFSKYVVLLHDYPLYEFTILVRM
jgi:SAM-dependent methyltransferase